MIATLKKRRRNIEVFFFLSEEENQQLKENMRTAGIRNKSAYIRKMILDGYVICQDYSTLHKFVVELSRIGSNVNQIARVANTYHEIDLPEIRKVTEELQEWQRRFLKALQ